MRRHKSITGNIRPATRADLAGLLQLEASFPSDNISRRGFRHLLTHGNCTVLVIEVAEKIVANIVILYRRGSTIARLYSLIVAADYRQRGLARTLLAAAEQVAEERGCACLSLELRTDNLAALRLYQSLGYTILNTKSSYYEDQSAAFTLRKNTGLVRQ